MLKTFGCINIELDIWHLDDERIGWIGYIKKFTYV